MIPRYKNDLVSTAIATVSELVTSANHLTGSQT